MNGMTFRTVQSGLTLIELLIALVLTLFLAGGAVTMHLVSRDAFLDAEQLSRIQENVRFASDYVTRDIRTAGFRDEGSLRAGHELQIRQQYLDIAETGGVLTIRYAGRGHCSEAFDEFRLVENQYAVNDAGELACRGRSVTASSPGDTLITAQDWGPTYGLARGLRGITFEKICPDGGSDCPCNLVDHFESSCIGVRVGMAFEGQRELSDPATTATRTVELTVALRNIILDHFNANAAAEES